MGGIHSHNVQEDIPHQLTFLHHEPEPVTLEAFSHSLLTPKSSVLKSLVEMGGYKLKKSFAAAHSCSVIYPMLTSFPQFFTTSALQNMYSKYLGSSQTTHVN